MSSSAFCQIEQLSLDEYIRKKKMEAQFSLLNHRKKEKNIDKDALDNELDVYIHASGISRYDQSGNEAAQSSTGCGRYDRKSLLDDDSSDEEMEKPRGAVDSDIDMERHFEAIPEEDEGDLNGLLNFQTAESKQGIRVRSQQWRMLPENLLDRPKGVKRLEVLPLEDHERFKRGVQAGKIQKRKRCRNSSFSSMGSGRSTDDLVKGTFVERGSFTYKLGDRNRDGSSEGIIGIERAKKIPVQAPVPASVVPNASGGITINMDWGGLFQGLKQCVETIREPAPVVNADSLSVASKKLLAALRAKRATIKQEKIEADIAAVQGRAPVFDVDHDDSLSFID